MYGKTSSQDEALVVADLIDRFLDGDVGPYEWDDFCSYRQLTSEMELLRVESAKIETEFPATTSDQWCSAEGIERLRGIALRLRNETAA